MKTSNAELMRMARESLNGKWGLAIGAFLVYMVIISVLQFIPFLGPLSLLILGGPLTLGLIIFSLTISRNQDTRFEQIFEGFQNFGTAFSAYIIVSIFIILWMLLLIVPGIIAAISYSMTFYIIADDSSIEPMAAVKKSKKMMYGYKWKFFCLGLRFIGWAILCILTLGIGFLWLIPYVQVSVAKFYDDVKSNVVEEVKPNETGSYNK